jgi:hypothetical protein
MTRLALLIDGENLPAKFGEGVVKKARMLGTLVAARVYGHFAGERMSTWRRVIADLELAKVDIARTSPGKNAADFKLVIEAMDMLHTRGLDGICIASSDGDFTALAERIKASAVTLFVFAERKAPPRYQALADQFFDVGELARAAPKPQQTVAAKAAKPPAAKPPVQKPRELKRTQPGAATALPTKQILAAIETAAGTDGWAHSQKIGNALTAADREFRIKKYAPNMKALLQLVPDIEIRKDASGTYARRR